MDVERIERIESDIDQLIERRSRQKEEANRVEEAWRESERAYQQRRREEMRAEWVAYHLGRAAGLERTAASLAAEHRRRANVLLQEGA